MLMLFSNTNEMHAVLSLPTYSLLLAVYLQGSITSALPGYHGAITSSLVLISGEELNVSPPPSFIIPKMFQK